MTLVSFVIPTLNRGAYVVRAVDSCMRAADRAGTGVEVIVLDSQSDDGSWEALVQRFDQNKAVKLVQNQRGLGPTHSWLDGAELVTGDFATFIWSDDYIAPHFLTRLLPALSAGAAVAIGRGAIRDIDNDALLHDKSEAVRLAGAEALEGYLGRHPLMIDPPVSPASALFRRDAFDRWQSLIPTTCKSSELRRQLMWRRAIGPDLLLYLEALRLAASGPDVVVSQSEVVQFSSHSSSITIGSPTWLLRVGYWLSRTAAVLDLGVLDVLTKARGRRLCARILLQGVALSRNVPSNLSGLEDRRAAAAMVLDEMSRLKARLVAEQGRAGLVTGLAQMAAHEVSSRLLSKGRA